MSRNNVAIVGYYDFVADRVKTWSNILDRNRTSDVTGTSGLEFEDFCLNMQLLHNVYLKGWGAPSPVQEEVIPLALSGFNVIARAKSGTGKSGAFIIPLLQNIVPGRQCIQALILAPTHELVRQIAKVAIALAQSSDIKIMSTTDVSMLKDDIMRLMQKVHVVVATPMRMLQLIEHGVADVANCRTLVLDEVDELLLKCRDSQLERIVCRLPSDRQFLLFSATYPTETKEFIETRLPQPWIINLMGDNVLEGVTQYHINVKEKQKFKLLRRVLRQVSIKQLIVFCSMRAPKRMETLSRKIFELGMSCYYVHDLMQVQHRSRVLHDFARGDCRGLVANDLVSRGIDAPNVNVVINWDFPSDPDVYLHRIGRTGRYGRVGVVINFVTNKAMNALASVNRVLNAGILPAPDVIPEHVCIGAPSPPFVQPTVRAANPFANVGGGDWAAANDLQQNNDAGADADAGAGAIGPSNLYEVPFCACAYRHPSQRNLHHMYDKKENRRAPDAADAEDDEDDTNRNI